MKFIQDRVDSTLALCTPLTRENAPGICQAIEELSAKAGIAPPKLYKLKPNLGITTDNFPAGAMDTGKGPAILLGHDINHKIFGVDYHDYNSISDEFKAILAHELGHVKRQDTKFPTGKMWQAKASPYACMIGAIVGLYAYRSYSEKKKPENIDPATLETDLKQHIQAPAHNISTLTSVGKAALYTVTALAGYTSGLFVMRSMRQNMEYACDAYSKDLMGSGAPLAGALEKIYAHFKQIKQEQFAHLPEGKQQTLEKLSTFLESFLHPPVDKRVAALRS